MALVYIAVTKSPNTILCEAVKEGMETAAKLTRNKMKDIYREQHDFKLDNEYWLYALKLGTDNGAQFVCACKKIEVYDDKAYGFLEKVRREFFEEFFSGKPEKFSSDKKFQPMCYQKDFSSALNKLMGEFDTGIGFGRVNEAQRKIDETAYIMQKNLQKQYNNNLQTLDLYSHTEKIKDMGKVLLKDSKKFEEQIKKNSFWLCSRNCILMFVIPIVILILYVCASFVYCGDLTMLVGCRVQQQNVYYNRTAPPRPINDTIT